MIVNFFVEKKIDRHDQLYIEKNLKKIALIYLKTNFLFDFVTILPLWEICYKRFDKYEYLLLIKTLRIKNGLAAINASIYINTLRKLSMKKIEKMIKD